MSSSIFRSNISERRWVEQLSDHFIVYVDSRPSIFKVPKSVRDTKPEAYAPQQIGIGAFHHLRPDLEEMESRKFEAVKQFLNQNQYENFKSLIVDKVKEIEPSIRSCYNKFLDIDGDTLAWVMAIDGVYLLHLLSTYSGKNTINVDDRNVAQDIVMMENQIPRIVLKTINEALQPSNKEFLEMLSFCKAHTPLHLIECPVPFDYDLTSDHLLSYMYNLIYNRDTVLPVPVQKKTVTKSLQDDIPTQFSEVARAAADLTGQTYLKLLAILPLQKFADLLKKDNHTTNSSIEEIKIPSASQLHKISNIQFQVRAEFADPRIGVSYDENNRTLFLPVITLNTDSEVILRNLVAYEVAEGKNNVVSGLVDFMCGLIDTAQDVDLLKEKGIIKTDLPSEEIAKIFNGISKSNQMRPDLEETTQKLNVVYDSSFTVKTRRFIKDHFVPSEDSVKLFLAILLVLILTFQAFCQVYGCSARWFGKRTS